MSFFDTLQGYGAKLGGMISNGIDLGIDVNSKVKELEDSFSGRAAQSVASSNIAENSGVPNTTQIDTKALNTEIKHSNNRQASTSPVFTGQTFKDLTSNSVVIFAGVALVVGYLALRR